MTVRAINPAAYTPEEIQQAIDFIEQLLYQVKTGNLDEHLSPALGIAIDCMDAELKRREK